MHLSNVPLVNITYKTRFPQLVARLSLAWGTGSRFGTHWGQEGAWQKPAVSSLPQWVTHQASCTTDISNAEQKGNLYNWEGGPHYHPRERLKKRSDSPGQTSLILLQNIFLQRDIYKIIRAATKVNEELLFTKTCNIRFGAFAEIMRRSV